jgi:malonyl-CoA O-methyltransferase
MDAARPTADGLFYLIATSMTLHWLADPAAALTTLRQRLAPGGVLIYATIGSKSFPEWREVLEAQGLPVGLLDTPALPGIVDEECIVADKDTLGFLRRMKAIGGLTPREGYAALPPGRLRRAIRIADKRHCGRITWHIVYGRLAASQSSPSISPA